MSGGPMNAERLLDVYEQISEAPDAIARLRRFVLDLAVRGKLVEQRPTETFDLSVQPSAPCFDQGEFYVPANWTWACVQDVAVSRLGKMLDKGKNKGVPKPYLRNINVRWFGFELDDLLEMPFEERELQEFQLLEGDVLVCEGGEPGRAAVWQGSTEEVYFQKALHRIRFQAEVNPLFFTWVLRESADNGRLANYFTGSGIKHFTGRNLAAFRFPLPPLAEQHRIVAKVDELMVLCDRLEEARKTREEVRDKLTAASLARLTAPDTNPEDFHTHAAFALEALPALTTRPDQIKTLRQTILNLAVRGKLVEQDPADEPATELVMRIGKKRAELVKAGEAKKLKPRKGEAWPFVVPGSWSWCALGEVSSLITKGSSPKWQGVGYVDKDAGLLFITSENVGNFTLRKLDDLKYVEARFKEIEPRSMLCRGDILINLVGASIGRSAIYNLDVEANINQAVALVRMTDPEDCPSLDYLLKYLNSDLAVDLMLGSRVTTAQPNISLTDVAGFPVPLPPLAEQHRIVAKVDTLMALCDRLEAALTTADTTRTRLLEALLHEALEPVTDTKEAAE